MAGAGKKTFAVNEVLSAADVNQYLMDQSVMRFADSTARSSAIPSPSEGMVSYLDDSNQVEVYDGSGWVNFTGDITQVTAGTALTGGGTEGNVTLNVDETELFTGGTAGYTALSNGTAGLSYQPVSHNYIINGAFDIWQRGDAVSQTSNQYTSDRWYVRDFGQTWSVTEQDSGLTGFEKCARVQRDSGDTAAASFFFGQPIETSNAIQLAGQDVVVSFYARKGADYSASSDELITVVRTGTADNENLLLGGTGVSTVTNQIFNLSSSWQKFTVISTVGATTKSLAVFFNRTTTGTAGANDYYEITGVQLEAGSIATPFKRNANSIQGELAACQHYFQKSYSQDVAPATATADGGEIFVTPVSSSTQSRTVVRLNQPMRASPTVKLYSTNSGTVAKIYNESTTTDIDGATAQIGDGSFIYRGDGGTVSAGNLLRIQWTAESEL